MCKKIIMVQITVDTREPLLASLLQSYPGRSGTGISVEVIPLDIADVRIQFGEEAFILVERKSCMDLISSVKDGRYREQKVRLLASGAKTHHLFYLLEGVPSMTELQELDMCIGGMQPSVLSGAILHTMLRDGIHVVCVPNTEETAAWVWTMAQKCLANPEKILGGAGAGGSGGTGYAHHIRMKKMDNVTPDVCYLMQLSQIPTISVTIASEIVAKYPTMLRLLTHLSHLGSDEERIRCLSEIPKIGKKKAQQLLSYLLPEPAPTEI